MSARDVPWQRRYLRVQWKLLAEAMERGDVRMAAEVFRGMPAQFRAVVALCVFASRMAEGVSCE